MLETASHAKGDTYGVVVARLQLESFMCLCSRAGVQQMPKGDREERGPPVVIWVDVAVPFLNSQEKRCQLFQVQMHVLHKARLLQAVQNGYHIWTDARRLCCLVALQVKRPCVSAEHFRHQGSLITSMAKTARQLVAG